MQIIALSHLILEPTGGFPVYWLVGFVLFAYLLLTLQPLEPGTYVIIAAKIGL